MGAARRADTWVRPYDRGVTLTSILSRQGPVEGEGVWEPRGGRTRGSAPTTGESPSPPYRVRGRLRPLPSRERGYGSRAAGGHVGLPLRPGSHPHPRIEYGAGSALSRLGRGGMGAARRADTWVRPYDRGVTLTPVSSTGQAPPSPVEGEGVWERRGGRTRGSPTTGESPSPQPSPVEGEGVWEPRGGRTRGSAPTTGESPSPQPSPIEGEGVWERRGGRTRGSAPTTGESPSPQPSPVEREGVWEPRGGRTRGSAPTTGESPSPQPSPVKGEEGDKPHRD